MDKPPKNANAPAGDRGGRGELNDSRTVGQFVDNVNNRYCRPVSVADIVLRVFENLGIQVESGSDFEERRKRCRDAALSKSGAPGAGALVVAPKTEEAVEE